MRATRTGIVPQRTQKLTENLKNLVKNGNKTEHASKTLPGTTFRRFEPNFAPTRPLTPPGPPPPTHTRELPREG